MKSALEAAFLAVTSAMLASNYEADGMKHAAIAWAICAILWGLNAIGRVVKS